MAKFIFSSLEEIEISMRELSNMSPSELLAVVMAAAEVFLDKQKEFLASHTTGTGTLANSLKIEAKEGSSWVFISPKGKHHGAGSGKKTKAAGYHRPKKGAGISGKRKHHGMTKATSAMDVGYYLEYGTARTTALHWMETSNEQAEKEASAAMEKAWDALLKSKGL